jgi:hypothetical protein
MIHLISERWKIPAELLVKPYKAHVAAYTNSRFARPTFGIAASSSRPPWRLN